MRILIAEILRSFSQVLAYNENSDPLYKKLKTKNLTGGFPPLTTLIDTRISGWKMQKNTEGEGMFKELKSLVEKDQAEPALKLYGDKIVPFLKQQHGAKI